MPRFPSHRSGRIALAAGAVQTIIAAVAAAVWLGSGDIAAALALFGSWAALAVVLMISSGAADAIVTLESAAGSPIGGRARPESDRSAARTLKYCASLPLFQIAVGAAIITLASLGGFAVEESVLVGPDIAGALGTSAVITGGAYLALLCGVLLTLLTVVPALMIWRVTRRGERDGAPKRSRMSLAALAVIVLAMLPLAVAATLGVTAPSGGSPRAEAYSVLLTVLGFDLSDQGYTVEHWGWLWTARISGAVLLAAVAATFLARRSARLSADARRSAG